MQRGAAFRHRKGTGIGRKINVGADFIRPYKLSFFLSPQKNKNFIITTIIVRNIRVYLNHTDKYIQQRKGETI